jgi:hypothetical protein
MLSTQASGHVSAFNIDTPLRAMIDRAAHQARITLSTLSSMQIAYHEHPF